MHLISTFFVFMAGFTIYSIRCVAIFTISPGTFMIYWEGVPAQVKIAPHSGTVALGTS